MLTPDGLGRYGTRQATAYFAMKRADGGFRAIFEKGPAHALSRLPVLLILWYIAIFHTVVIAVNLSPRAFHHDFSVFYSSAVALRQHLDPYTVDLVPIGRRLGMKIWPLIHTTDTPTALLLFMPFSLAIPVTAHNIWIAINGAALVIALLFLIRPKYSGLDTRIAFAIAALALLYAPVTENFLFSQRQILILLLLVMVMRSLERGRGALAGMLLAVSVAYRIFPILMAGYFIVRRQWRPLFYMGLGLVVIGAVTIATMGLPLCLNFLQGMHLAMTAAWYDPADVAIRAVVIRSFANVFGDRLDSRIETLQRITIFCAQLTVLTLTAWPALRNSRHPVFDQRDYSLWAAATVVLSPLSWIHYMVLLLIPLVAIVGATARQQCSRRAFYAAVASYLLISVTIHLRPNFVDADHWAHGIRYLAEGSSVALLLAFLAAWWFATDLAGSAEVKKVSRTPPACAPADQSPAQIVSLRSTHF
jgi:alpha-1,2-mannosyltransferase